MVIRWNVEMELDSLCFQCKQ